jgi:DNA-binding beta-propeller fold protein YncE
MSTPALSFRLALAIVLLPPGAGFLAAQTAPPQELLYVGNNQAGTVSVIEVPAYRVIGEFDALPDVADRPTLGATDDLVGPASGEVLYISRGPVRDVAAFSTATRKLLWKVPVGGVADHFTLSRDGRLLFVSVENEGHVLVIDTEKRGPVGRFESGPGPHCIRLSPDGRRVYSGGITGDNLTVADASTLKVLDHYEFDEGVRPFDITADGKTMYIQLSKLHGFLEFDLQAGRITRTIALPVPPGVTHQKAYPHTAHHGLSLTPDGRHLGVLSTVASYFALLSVPDLKVEFTVPVGTEPSWLIPSLDGRNFYASARKGDTVSVVSVADQKEIARIKVGRYPQRMWTMREPPPPRAGSESR